MRSIQAIAWRRRPIAPQPLSCRLRGNSGRTCLCPRSRLKLRSSIRWRRPRQRPWAIALPRLVNLRPSSRSSFIAAAAVATDDAPARSTAGFASFTAAPVAASEIGGLVAPSDRNTGLQASAVGCLAKAIAPQSGHCRTDGPFDSAARLTFRPPRASLEHLAHSVAHTSTTMAD